MLNKNAKLWVEALRSGEYKQLSAGHLSRDDKYCCLAVACEIAMKNGVKIKKKISSGIVFYDKHDMHLPDSVKDWLNLTEKNGRYYPEPTKYTHLTNDNDGGKTFAEIADIIESEPTNLFRVTKKEIKNG